MKLKVTTTKYAHFTKDFYKGFYNHNSLSSMAQKDHWWGRGGEEDGQMSVLLLQIGTEGATV